MANTLGSIIVDLQANTAAFVEGMTRASSAAKKAGRDIEGSFSQLGRLAETLLAPFGEVGAGIGRIFESVGRISSGASEHFAKVGGGMSYLAVGAGVAAGATVTAAGAAVGLAIATAYSIRELTEQAETVGISVQSLAKLSFAAKQAGVNQESLTKALQLMSANAVKAATAPKTAATGFSRLGVDVKDTNHQLKDASTLFTEVITKLDDVKDRTAAVGLSKGIFGRGGAEMLKFDPTEAKEAIETATKLGIVPTPKISEESVRFVQSINTIEAAGHGLAIRLTSELLPAISSVANEIVKAFENKSGPIYALTDSVISVAKATFFLVDTFITAGEQIALFAKFAVARVEAVAEGVRAMAKAPDFSGLVSAYTNTDRKLLEIDNGFFKDSKKAWDDLENTRQNLFGPAPPTNNVFIDKNRTKGVDLEPKEKDDLLPHIEKEVAALKRKAAAELELAAATGLSIAQQRLQAAATAGKEVVEKFKDDAEEKLKNKKITLGEYQKILATLKVLGPQIQTAEAEIFVAKDLKATADEFQKQNELYETEIAGLQRLADAYKVGGKAISNAQIEIELDKQKTKVQQAQQEYDLLAKTFGVTSEAAKQAKASLDSITASLTAQRGLLEQKRDATLSDEIGKQTDAFRTQLPALQAVTAAYHQNAEAQREAQIGVKVADFKTQHPGVDDSEVKKFYELEKAKSDEAYQRTLAQEAARYDLIGTYDIEAEHLNALKSVLESYGADTLAIEAAIDDAQQKQIQDWDKVAAKVGDFGQQLRAMLNEIELEGDNFSEKFFGTMKKGLDGVAGELAKFVVTGKSNFKQLFQSIEEEIVKAQIKKGFSVILGQIFGGPGATDRAAAQDGARTPPFAPGPSGAAKPAGVLGAIGKIFGVDSKTGIGKPDGSSANPFYVQFANASGAIGGGSTTSSGGLFGKSGLDNLPLFNTNSGSPFGASGLDNLPLTNENPTAANPLSGLTDMFSGLKDSLTSVFSGLGSTFSSLFSSLGSLGGSIGGGLGGFASLLGFLAEGGPVKGPGSSTSDSIPTMLSDGEYVVKADAVRNFGMKNLEAINSMTHTATSKSHTGNFFSSVSESARAFSDMPGITNSINFGGFREFGGDVTPGKSYIVGERRAELFTPRTAGTIHPAVALANGNNQNQQPVTYHNEFHFHNVSDMDSFNRSKPQLMAEFQRQAAVAHSRNRSVGGG